VHLPVGSLWDVFDSEIVTPDEDAAQRQFFLRGDRILGMK